MDNKDRCPKNYGAYDVMCKDCEHCKQGFLYQVCQVGRDHLACAGWNREDGCYCCTHWIEKDNEKN